MKIFKIVVSNDAAEFEEMVNKAMDEGYIFLEGQQTLIVDQKPTQYQFVRHMLHSSHTHTHVMNKFDAELRVNLEFSHANREALIQAKALQLEIERAAWKINDKKRKDSGESL